MWTLVGFDGRGGQRPLGSVFGLDTKEQVPFLLRADSDPGGGGWVIGGGDSRPVVRAAFVAVIDHDTQHATLVAFFASEALRRLRRRDLSRGRDSSERSLGERFRTHYTVDWDEPD